MSFTICLLILALSLSMIPHFVPMNRRFGNHSVDVWLDIPNFDVNKISLIGQNLKIRVNLSANVANLVSLNAGVDLSLDDPNITIEDVKSQVQLAMDLDNVAKIIIRTLTSLDLNPALLSSVKQQSFERVHHLLSTSVRNGQVTRRIINNVGQILEQVILPTNQVLSSIIIGDYKQNMTFTGVSKTLSNGYTIKQYRYSLSSNSTKFNSILIDITLDEFEDVLNTNIVELINLY